MMWTGFARPATRSMTGYPSTASFASWAASSANKIFRSSLSTPKQSAARAKISPSSLNQGSKRSTIEQRQQHASEKLDLGPDSGPPQRALSAANSNWKRDLHHCCWKLNWPKRSARWAAKSPPLPPPNFSWARVINIAHWTHFTQSMHSFCRPDSHQYLILSTFCAASC